MSTANDTRKRRREQGLCAECGCPPEPGRPMCAPCRELGKEKQQRYAAQQRHAGLCSCGAARDPGKLSCTKCRTYRLGRDRNRRARGVCSSCASPAANGKTLCGSCNVRRLASEFQKNKQDRESVLRHYGGKCQLCGEREMAFLSIDHIGGGGSAHRKILKGGGIWPDIIRSGFPDTYRCLCFNCNCGERTVRGGVCRLCDQPLDADSVTCLVCSTVDRAKYYAIRRRFQIRSQVIAGYGGKCACCGHATRHHLTLEHKEGGGRKHREESNGGLQVYRWAIKNDFPDSLTVLCFNCNCARGFHGGCPHQSQRSPAPEVQHVSR